MATGEGGSAFCGHCGHRDVYHQMNASAGERRCVWNPEKCRCPNFDGERGRNHLRVV
jgi:hypothetical protein